MVVFCSQWVGRHLSSLSGNSLKLFALCKTYCINSGCKCPSPTHQQHWRGLFHSPSPCVRIAEGATASNIHTRTSNPRHLVFQPLHCTQHLFIPGILCGCFCTLQQDHIWLRGTVAAVVAVDIAI